MAAEKIDALQLDIQALATTDAIDKLVDALKKLGSTLDGLNGKKLDIGVGEADQKVKNLNSSFGTTAIKVTAVVAAMKKMSDVISDGLTKSIEYQANLNLFSTSLGQYSDSAMQYAETVRDAMGIDPSEWLKTQGTFNNLIKGFGVAGDQAAYMSQNLTQLTYDISSFYGISTTEAERKINSAVAGKIEPVRRIGYDLSQSKLTGILQDSKNYGRTTYSVNSETGALEANSTSLDDNTQRHVANFNQLTQSTKAVARYTALMTQNTEVQGNWSRAMNDPNVQMKIFQQQINMTSRALGDIFIPALNRVLPYFTAFCQVLEEGFRNIAAFFGFELPDMSKRMNTNNVVNDTDKIKKNTGGAAKNAKKLKDYMIGIDELNVLRPDDGTSGGSGGGSYISPSGGSKLKTPGYDFTSGIADAIKKAKEKLQLLFADFLKHPITLPLEILYNGASLLGEKLWTLILGRTPEELRAEADAYGISVGEAFILAVGQALFGNPGAKIWEFILGKTPKEFQGEAEKYGWDAAEGICVSFYDRLNEIGLGGLGGGVSKIMESLFGKPDDLASEADALGKSVGEQFQNRFWATFFNSDLVQKNPILKLIFGDKLKEAQTNWNARLYESKKTIAPTKTLPTTIPEKEATVNIKFKYGESNYNDLKKHAEAAADSVETSYKNKLERDKDKVRAAGDEMFNAALNGASGNGMAAERFGYVSAEQAKAYSNEFATKDALKRAYNKAHQLANNAESGINTVKAPFKTTGEQAGSGYVLGISSNRNLLKAKQNSEILGKNSLSALKNFLGIHSPSRAFMQVGDYSVEGYANAFTKYSYKVTNAVSTMADKALNAVNLSNSIVLGGQVANPMSTSISLPKTTANGYEIGMANSGAMATLSSNIYQAVVSGMRVVSDNINGRETKVIIDGKEVFSAVQKQERKLGAAISNGAFSR